MAVKRARISPRQLTFTRPGELAGAFGRRAGGVVAQPAPRRLHSRLPEFHKWLSNKLWQLPR